MNTLKLRKALLAGSALLVIGISGAAQAQEFSIDDDDNASYNNDQASPLTLNGFTGHDIRWNGDNGTILAADGNVIGDGTDTVLGLVAVAGADGDTLTISNAADDTDAPVTVTIKGIDNGAAAAINLTLAAAADGNNDDEPFTVAITGAVDLGTGTLLLTSDDGDGGNATNTIDVSISGSVTANTITLNVDDSVDGAIATDVTLTFNGTTAQTVNSAINGGAAGEGDIVLSNNHASGITFSGIIGATSIDKITVAKTNDISNATFTDNVSTASGIIIGDGANANTNTVTFARTSAGTQTITGVVQGTAGDTDNVVIGGGTGTKVVNASAWGGAGGNAAIDNLTINANSEFETGAAVQIGNATIGAGGVFDINHTVTVVNDIDFTGATGTIEVAAGVNIATGNIDNTSGTAGRGTLTFAGASVVQNIGTTASIATVNVDGAATKVETGNVKATTVNFGADSTIEVSGATYTVTNTTTTTTNTGTLEFDAAGAVTSASVIGATGKLLKNVLVSGAGTVVSQTGNIFATNVTFDSATAGLTLADASNLTAATVATVAGDGILTFSGASTVTGSIGVVGANELARVNFNGASGKTVAITGDLAATDIKIGGAGTVTVTGDIEGALDFDAGGTFTIADTKKLTGAVTAVDSTGTLTFAGAGEVTSTIGADGAELAALTLSGSAKTITVGGNTEAADNTTIGTNTLAITGTFDTDNDQHLRFSITDSTNYGKITSTAGASIHAGTDITLTVASDTYIPTNTSFTFVNGTGGAGVADITGTITDDSTILTFAQTTANDEDLILVATRTAMNTLTTGNNGNTGAVATRLDAIGADGDANLDSVQVLLQNASTTTELNNRLEALLPTVDGGVQVGAVSNVTSTTTGIIDTRIDGTSSSGISSGNFAGGSAMWLKGFATWADQGVRNGVDGYDAATYGGTIGFDTDRVMDNAMLGLALTYAYTDIDAENANSTNSEVDTYQFAVYGSRDIAPATRLSGTLGYSWSNTDQTRYNVAGVSGNNATADFDSNAFFARGELARGYKLDRTMTLTPAVSANYIYLDTEGYTERGSTANLRVQDMDLNILELGIGLNARWDLEQNDGSTIIPELGVAYRYDVIGDEIETTAAFTGGGGNFQTSGGDPEQSTLNLNAGLTWETTANWDITASYMFEGKDEYDSHSAQLKARFGF